MNEQKSLVHHLVEAYERYRAERRAAAPKGDTPSPRSSHWRRLLRWLMPNGGTLLLIAILLLTQNVWARPAASPAAPGPSATTVNYQGRLANAGGTPLDGTYGMSFSLWDAAADGNLIWGPEDHVAVPVSDGLFSVGLGSQTAGGIPTTTWNGDRYLEIAVGGETLSPRELIRSVPVAGMALTVPDKSITAEKLDTGALPVLTASTTATAAWRVPQCGGDFNSDGDFYLIPGLSLDVAVDEPSTLLVDFTGLGYNSSAGKAIYTTIFVDNTRTTMAGGKTLLGGCRNSRVDSGDPWCTLANTMVKELSPGNHTVDVRVWCDGSGTAKVDSGWVKAIIFP